MAATATDDDGGTEGEADIVAAGDVEGWLAHATTDVEGGLGFGDAGGRLEGYTKYYRRAVRDTAVDAAGTVLHGGHRTFFKLKFSLFTSLSGRMRNRHRTLCHGLRDGEHSVRKSGTLPNRTVLQGQQELRRPGTRQCRRANRLPWRFCPEDRPTWTCRLSSDLYQTTASKASP